MAKYLFLVFTIFFIFLIHDALLPFAIGIIVAYVLNPIMVLIETGFLSKFNFQKGKRIVAVMLTFLLIIFSSVFLVYGFSSLLIGSMSFSSIEVFLNDIALYFDQLGLEQFGFTGSFFHDISFIKFTEADVIRFSKIVLKILFKVSLGIIIAIYLLKDKEVFLRLCNKFGHLFLTQKIHGITREILFQINQVLSDFLKGVMIDSVIVAFLSSLVLYIQGIDHGVLIGCFAGIANIIPYFGPVLGVVPAFFAGLTKGGLSTALVACASLFVIQQIECNFLYPKIIGKSTGLHPLLILISVTIAGYYGGLLWMILAVPMAGIVNIFFLRWAENQ